MKILYVITSLGQGGAERIVCDLADEMFNKGHEVRIAYLTGTVLTQPNNKEIKLKKVGLTNMLSLPKAYLSLSEILKDYQPDIVHTHMIHANIIMRFLRMLIPMNKLITTAHNSNEGSALRMLIYRVTHSLADLTTNVSNTAVTSFEKKYAVPKGGMKTIYNGVNFNKFCDYPDAKDKVINELNIPIDTKIILAVGRFDIQKNYPNMLLAIKNLKDLCSIPFILLIAGDGELRVGIEKLIVELDLSDDIILLGRRNDIPKLMNACDVFVLSSDYEGLPTVLIEALACQANVVSTDVSGVHEIMDKHGKVIPVKEPKALAQALRSSLVKNSKNILGRQFVEAKFDVKIISDEWLKIYNET